LETEGLRGGIEGVNCSLWTAKKYTDVGRNSWGKNWLRPHETLAFKISVRSPKITDLRHLSTFCFISVFRRGVNKIFTFLGCYTALFGSSVPEFLGSVSVPLPLGEGTGRLSRNAGKQRNISIQQPADAA